MNIDCDVTADDPAIPLKLLLPCLNPACAHLIVVGRHEQGADPSRALTCCARAATEATVPASPPMNFRRRISVLQRFVGKPIAILDALEPALMTGADDSSWPKWGLRPAGRYVCSPC
jgi:hypothetical protein